MQYDKNNVFYKIIHKELNANIVLNEENYMAFYTIDPKAPTHILIIPKGEYVDMYDFMKNATPQEILDFNEGIVRIIDMMKLNQGGYRIVSNSGKFGMQEVPHFHIHIMGNSPEK